jgi:hypothetical protein
MDRNLSEQGQSLLRHIHELSARWTAALKRGEIVGLIEQLAGTREHVAAFISRWIWNYNRRYARPTAEQLARVKKALKEAKGELPESVLLQLEFYTTPA